MTSAATALTSGANGMPFFCVPGAAATPLSLYSMARHIQPGRPVYAPQYGGVTDDEPIETTMDAMSERFLDQLRAVQPAGPYLLGGYCLGGLAALDVAVKLRADGEHVALLALIETIPPMRPPPGTEPADDGGQPGAPPLDADALTRSMNAIDDYMNKQLTQVPLELAQHLRRVRAAHSRAGMAYDARRVDAPVMLFRTTSHPESVFAGWPRFAAAEYNAVRVPGDTFSILKPPDVAVLGKRLGAALAAYG